MNLAFQSVVQVLVREGSESWCSVSSFPVGSDRSLVDI